MNTELKEVLDAGNALLFCEEELSPVFCKPKLIPLKSVTLEKLEKMQSEAMEIMKKIDESNRKTPAEVSMESGSKNPQENIADIWTPEGNHE
uniref:BBSome-interacting protein 1 n=1 Tax=Setaria digitata TaxID=48799 RepID=A0A915PG31_9BILA